MFELGDYIGVFDTRQVISLPPRQLLFDLAPTEPAGARWQQGAWLERADMRRIQMVAGQATTLTLRWRAAAPLAAGDQVFVRRADDSGRAPIDVERLCQSGTPADWRSDKDSTTSFTIAADPAIPAGRYDIQVGLRAAAGGALLPLADGNDLLTVGTLAVEQK
jgi:hypothetical protein